MRHMTQIKQIVALMAVGTFVVGCGDFQSGQTSAEPKAGFAEDQPDQPDQGEWMLSPVDGNVQTVPRGKTAQLKVELVDPDGKTRADETIDFEMVESSAAGSKLASQFGVTDDKGIASVEFRAGTTLSNFEVKATHREADPATFDVEVTPLPKGHLAVTFNDAGTDAAPLGAVDVSLYPKEQVDCSNFDGLAKLGMAPRQRRVPDTSKRALFEMLEPNSTFTVVAHAFGPGSRPLAAGCRSEVDTVSGKTKKVRVDLGLLPLDPQGTYDVQSTWDLTSAVGQQAPAGEKINKIVEIFADPAQSLIDRFGKEIEEATSSLIAMAIKNSSVAQKIKNEINQRIQQNGLLDKLNKVSDGLKQTVSNLEVESQLTVQSPEEDGQVGGKDVWKTAYVYYKANCGPNASPDCGRREVELTSDQSGGLESSWTGRVKEYNKLDIDPHTIRVDLGHLLVEVLQKVVVPELTNGKANTIEGAVKHWFDCQGFAQNLANSGQLCAGGFCVPQSTIESACTATVGNAFDYKKIVAENLAVKMTLEVGGNGTLSKLNSNGKVAEIVDGTFQGWARTQVAGNTAPVKATWSGERVGE